MPDGDLATAVARRMVSAVLKSLSPHVMQWNYGRRVCVRCGQSDDGPCRPLVTRRDIEAMSKQLEE